jgi:hypothetical protein
VADEFSCAVDEKYRSACTDLPKYPGSRYCVLHEPDEAKDKEVFEKVIRGKLTQKNYDFRGTVFPEGTSYFRGVEFRRDTYFTGATFIGGAQFRDAMFRGGQTSFSDAQFSGGQTSFEEAQFIGEGTYFSGARFNSSATYFYRARFIGEETYFERVQFSGEWTFFKRAQFSGGQTSFSWAQFSSGQTSFEGAQFRSAETEFQEATFVKEVAFTGATFSEKVAFWGRKANPVFDYGAWAWFNRCRIDKPEQFTFDTVLLHPCWFINTDVDKVDFMDVKWYGMPGGPEGTLDEEISALTARDEESPHALLSKACQRLSANAEENRNYPLANEFYYWSMDALRKENWRQFGLIRTMYWALSGYGVRAPRAFSVLLGRWAVFVLLYMLVPSSPFSGCSVSDFGEAIVYSLGAMARLNPEAKPESGCFQFLVTVEGLVGPLQIGLFLLAIRRQVMR